MQTETHPQPRGEADDDDESWDLQFDGEPAEPVNETTVPFRPLGG